MSLQQSSGKSCSNLAKLKAAPSSTQVRTTTPECITRNPEVVAEPTTTSLEETPRTSDPEPWRDEKAHG